MEMSIVLTKMGVGRKPAGEKEMENRRQERRAKWRSKGRNGEGRRRARNRMER